MVPQTWIIEYLKMFKISDKVVDFIMKNYKVELTGGEKTLAEVKIQLGIFQGDALSQLSFVITMMPVHYKFRKYTGS